MIALFIGPDDADTCDGCDDAVNGNPYDVDDCPEPGDFECMNRCRHMVQLGGEDAAVEQGDVQYVDNVGFISAAGIAAGMGLGFADAFDSLNQDEQDQLDGMDFSTMTDEDLSTMGAALVDMGIAPEDIAAEMGLSADEEALLTNSYDDSVAASVDYDSVLSALQDTDFDLLQSMLNSEAGGDARAILETLGAQGFPAADGDMAETLAQVLGKTAVINDDGSWSIT